MVHGYRPVVNDPLRTAPSRIALGLLRPCDMTTKWNRRVTAPRGMAPSGPQNGTAGPFGSGGS